MMSLRHSVPLRAVLLGALACGTSEDAASPTDATDATGDTTDMVVEPTDYPTGLSEWTLEHNGEERSYLLYVPEAASGADALPLMMVFHGYGGTKEEMMATSDMRALADTESFVLLYPEGTLLEGETHWNTYPPGPGNKSEAEDYAFIDTLLDTLQASLPIDDTRVYASGYSNGGDFTYTLACYLTDRITAIVPVSGLMWTETQNDCVVNHPTAILSLHGDADFVRPYGGYPQYMASVPAGLQYWAGQNGISGDGDLTTLNKASGTVERLELGPGDGGVEMLAYKFINGGHIWFDFEDDGVQTETLIWNFVSQFDTTGRR
ncbi:MAG: alpha/beta hydrolase family esterase [Myxococcota bacterium]